MGSRATLLELVLVSFGNYYMSMFQNPKVIISYLEALKSRFCMGKVVERNALCELKKDVVKKIKKNDHEIKIYMILVDMDLG